MQVEFSRISDENLWLLDELLRVIEVECLKLSIDGVPGYFLRRRADVQCELLSRGFRDELPVIDFMLSQGIIDKVSIA